MPATDVQASIAALTQRGIGTVRSYQTLINEVLAEHVRKDVA